MHFNILLTVNSKVMKKYELIIGIDVSKLKLDVCFLSMPRAKPLFHLVIENNRKGMNKMLREVKKISSNLNHVLFCFENTGLYGMYLSHFLSELGADFWEVPAIEIKRAKGITRGKSDKVDARDIAFYAHTHMHKIALSEFPEEVILKLKLLQTEREKLVKSIQMFERTNEVEGFIDKKITRVVLISNRKTIRQLKKILREIDDKINAIVKSNHKISEQDTLIRSVPGIGKQTALYLIIATKCFTSFSNWRKMACYAGVAPFEYSSGSSIKGRTKVNHLADKKLKSLLTMCALSAKKHDKEIANYYERKLKEGKAPMLVMNAVKCKVLSRVFAVIKRETPFVNTYKFAA